MTPFSNPKETIPPLWRNRDYMLLWSGQIISTLGTTASAIIYPLLILALTNSPAAAGVAGALGSIPYIIFSLPVGALIDRWDRKKVMILCDIGRGLTLTSIPVAVALNVLTIWQIYLAVFIEGSLFVFFNIAETAALPRVVVKEQLPEAAAQNETAFAAAAIIGPSLGTLLYQTFGRSIPFLVDAISYGISVVSLTFIKSSFQSERVIVKRNLRAEIAEGIQWVWRKPLIRYMAFLTGGVNFIYTAIPLITIVLAKQMGANDAQIGLIFSIGGVGGIVGSLIGGRVQKRFRFGQVIIVTMWIPALLFLLFSFIHQFFLLGSILLLIYMTVPVYNIVQFSYRLALIPDELQGRVNSSFRLLAFGFQPLGAALSGLLLERIGTTPTVILFGLLFIALALITTFNPHVRSARPIEQVEITN